MKKRTERDILEKAAPDLFGDKTVLVKKNFVQFGVPAEAWKKIREWLDKGDGDQLLIVTVAPDSKLQLVIINEREQQLYVARGYKDN